MRSSAAPIRRASVSPDFKDHTTTWVNHIHGLPKATPFMSFSKRAGWLPRILNILEGYDLSALRHNSPGYLHLFVEAKKAAFSDRDTYITDPEFAKIPVDELLAKDYSRMIRDRIDRNQAKPVPSPFPYRKNSETVYVTAVDQERNAVSLISSIFMHFGSGMVVDGTGILLQNRGKAFSLNPKHFNRLEPHKRPMHTIIPAMVFSDEILNEASGDGCGYTTPGTCSISGRPHRLQNEPSGGNGCTRKAWEGMEVSLGGWDF
jgi:gamma-glutamyltranspeptidase/glutathione hydrolase